jgi:hypothetical protein
VYWRVYCKMAESLTIVERSTDASKLFACANLYQCEIIKSSGYQKVIDALMFLEQHTKPLKFKIKIAGSKVFGGLTIVHSYHGNLSREIGVRFTGKIPVVRVINHMK